jgi:membrane protease YdiL (CAAX protease family)
VVIFLSQPLISLLAALVVTLQGSTGIEPEIITQFIEQPLLIVPMVIWWLIFGPVIEEPDWRGYGLDGLQARHSALLSSLIIGAVWALKAAAMLRSFDCRRKRNRKSMKQPVALVPFWKIWPSTPRAAVSIWTTTP